jgi:hypothetical protein
VSTTPRSVPVCAWLSAIPQKEQAATCLNLMTRRIGSEWIRERVARVISPGIYPRTKDSSWTTVSRIEVAVIEPADLIRRRRGGIALVRAVVGVIRVPGRSIVRLGFLICKLEGLDFAARKLSPEEEALAELLQKLIQDYDGGIELPVSPSHTMVLFLMEQRGLKQADLVPVLGSRAQVSDLVNVNDKRGISKSQTG